MFGPENLEEAKRTVTAMVLEPVLYFSGPSHETIQAVIRVANNCSATCSKQANGIQCTCGAKKKAKVGK